MPPDPPLRRPGCNHLLHRHELQRQANRLIRQLRALVYDVTIEPVEAAQRQGIFTKKLEVGAEGLEQAYPQGSTSDHYGPSTHEIVARRSELGRATVRPPIGG